MDLRSVCGLEEDDATDLEQIPVVKTFFDFPGGDIAVVVFREAVVAVVVASLLEANEARVHLLMLPSDPKMHRGCVDLLDHAKAPAFHLGTRDEHAAGLEEGVVGINFIRLKDVVSAESRRYSRLGRC